ncbi:putative holin-like toxin [Falsibacillus albus]
MISASDTLQIMILFASLVVSIIAVAQKKK